MKKEEKQHAKVPLRELIEMADSDDPFFEVFFPDGEEALKESLKKSESFAYDLNNFEFNTTEELHDDIIMVLENYINIGSDNELDYDYAVADDKITLTYNYGECFQEAPLYADEPHEVEYPMTLTVSFKAKIPDKEVNNFDDIKDLNIDSDIEAKVESRTY